MLSRDIMHWGLSLDDYKNMFILNESELHEGMILDFWGGPSSFNAEMTKIGGKVVSVDPLYAFKKEELREKIEEVFGKMQKNIEENKDRFIWERIPSPEILAQIRKNTIHLFLEDFEKGLQEKRYLPTPLMELNFEHWQFDLALCAHHFFSNSDDLSMEEHVAAIMNLTFVAKEVRIFPLLDTAGNIPHIMGPLTQKLNAKELGVEIKAVSYDFLKKGNAMLKVWSQTCTV